MVKKQNTQKTKKELTAYQKELISSVKKVKEYMLQEEASLVLLIYKYPDILYNNDLKVESFQNNAWAVYFAIASDLVLVEKKNILDVITVELYLEKHPKLKKKYEEYGGYDTIEAGKECSHMENLEGYISNLNKWNCVLKLLKKGFPVHDRLSEFADMTAEEIYSEYEALLNHLFVNVDSETKSYNLLSNMHKTLDRLREGKNIGLPLYGSDILNKLIGGSLIGNITMFSAGSGIGKTTYVITVYLPSIIETEEPCCIMINEQDEEKWREELILWYANNKLGGNIPKYKVRDGVWNEEEDIILRKAADWLEGEQDKKRINIIPFQKYTAKNVIKIIKKYNSGFGCKYFVLDTFKASAGIKNEQVWLSMMNDSVDLYDTIKPSNKNVHLWLTSQLDKASTKQRYLGLLNQGMSKNVVDISSTSLMVRRPYEDEFEDGKNELTCYKFVGKNNKTKVPFKLQKGEHYIIIFIPKNRFGSSGDFQVVCKFDLSKNVYKELGIVYIEPDF